ncbi:hypothetical protein [Deinococcus hopiensis]|uniref:Uncharacterized protein n=1 Tax=Deinococcus hopiensis KR-140 TaxID=695939 RepID=A0A1W1UKT2_9DEIO|nr:hypothetical protein [Deinococcus hopiensis]SMB81670.1 hypothetical protein SAMN00790413_04671 [Deinococcus hopiensis KR-140]SMB96912.1 hypothetical protein SAMN00790413_06205 [Deinococcus hopiensis KR-140]SMB97622.1 hypothetical protein SAMN00790413_06088 [Deinococcus hopiensis KR-140]
MGKKRDIPTYKDTHPAHLARSAELERAGLKPAPDQLPAALFKYRTKDTEGTCALFERALCIPVVPKQDAS